MTVAELFARCLEAEGVRHVFGVPGEELEDLLFALEGSEIEFVPTRHEQGAAFIADVWGRLTGHAGVCLSTLGPGATNLLTGVADAQLDKAPLVAITAQGGRSRLHHESHQCLDVLGMFRPVTKWNSGVAAPEATPEVIRKAFKIAEEEKPGATHVELSEDVAELEVDPALEPLTATVVRRPAPDYKALDAAVELLAASRRPLAVAGNGAIRKLASRHLTKLVERLGIPTVSTFMGKGAVSDRSAESLMTTGIGPDDFALEALETADLVLTVGYDIAEVPPQKWNIGRPKKIIHIDFVPAEVYSDYVPAVELVCDVSGALWELDRRTRELEGRFDREWYRPIRRRILDDIGSYDPEPRDPLTVPAALNVLRRNLDDGGLLISDVGSHKMWIARNFPTYCANGCLISNGLASMGMALPGGIAASLHDPERQIVAAMGDGGFLMNAQELETARRVGAAFVAIVFRDDDYGLIRWKQEQSRGSSFGTRIGNPDLVAYGRSFGIRSHRATTAEELEGLLSEALSARELSLIDVPVDVTVDMELGRKLARHRAERGVGS